MSLSDEQQKRIADEEQTLQEVHTSLEQQLSWSHSRLRTESERAQDLTQSIVAARRDTDKQMLASDEAVAHQLRDAKRDEIETITKLQKKPYFAHIVLEELDQYGKLKQLEYKLGVAANPDCRIIDWRKAPIAKLYYEYKEGEEYSEEILGRDRDGVVRVRNKVDIENGELVGLTCGLGSFSRDKDSGEWQMASSGNTRRRSRGQLPNVLQLITAEQFSMITEDAESAVLIQGIAGSGKTTVALYRLAWLLHEDNSAVRANEVAVIVFSKTLKRYIQEALPGLEIGKVQVKTYHQWVAKSIQTILPQFFVEGELRQSSNAGSPGASRVKRSMAMLMRLEEYAEAVSSQLRKSLAKRLELGLPKSIQIHVEKMLNSKALPKPLLENIRTTAKSLPSDQALGEFISWCDESLQTVTDIGAHLTRIFANPDKILYWDDSKLLDKELVFAAKNDIERSVAQDALQTVDLALVMRLCQCLGISVRRLDGQNEVYEHLVVDEVQDFGAVELASIIAAVKSTSQLTIVGDVSQQIDTHTTFPGWERLRSHWALGDDLSQFHFLKVSHRSTMQIMRLANYIVKQKQPPTGRPGRTPLWFHCLTEDSMVSKALDWLARITEKFPDMLVAVVCRNEREAQYVASLLQPTFPQNVRCGIDEHFTFDEGILVTTAREVKGLEFEAVLVWDCSAYNYPDKEWARRWLYVSITRAEEYVCLVSHRRPSPILPHIHSKLVRGHLEEPETEDEAEN